MISKLIEHFKDVLKDVELIEWWNKHTGIDIKLAISELEATQWIPVSESSLPQKNSYIDLWCPEKKRRMIDFYIGNYTEFLLGHTIWEYSHWRYSPQPPKEN